MAVAKEGYAAVKYDRDLSVLELEIVLYKDAFSVWADERMLIYGLTKMEADVFRRAYRIRLPDEQTTLSGDKVAKLMPPADAPRAAPANGAGVSKGRKLSLEAYLPMIAAYMKTSPRPTIRELDRILQREGARYSNTSAIRNALIRIGCPVPPHDRPASFAACDERNQFRFAAQAVS